MKIAIFQGWPINCSNYFGIQIFPQYLIYLNVNIVFEELKISTVLNKLMKTFKFLGKTTFKTILYNQDSSQYMFLSSFLASGSGKMLEAVTFIP